MARVPQMTFMSPPSKQSRQTAPTAQHKTPVEKARQRFSLEGKAVVVTGGARGLGLVIAEGFLEHGASHLALFDIDADEGASAVNELLSPYAFLPERDQPSVSFHTVDVTDAEQLHKTVQAVAQRCDGIDVLITFAGIVDAVRAVEYTPEVFRKMLDVNTTGTFLTAQAIAKEMIARKNGGSIILTASMAGHIVNYPQVHVAYGTCKAAVQHMTHCLAAEWAVHGIRVNSLSPGYMDTRLNSPDALLDARPVWFERTPMGRIGNKDELIGAAVLLASHAGSFMTGSDIRVDGGYTLL